MVKRKRVVEEVKQTDMLPEPVQDVPALTPKPNPHARGNNFVKSKEALNLLMEPQAKAPVKNEQPQPLASATSLVYFGHQTIFFNFYNNEVNTHAHPNTHARPHAFALLLRRPCGTKMRSPSTTSRRTTS
jgi:hypothetical protein